ncbi:hypothetical protein AYI92_06730 [Shewanella xiamenensis]|nr:hypothetical protein AYI90_07110 [Shewanella xiamenensis]TVL21327.1 hypothetical protein AYI91_07755 [Shewanella xiamenensis]TVL27387.1 hypothetical protein AYI92_06730 [Shewanella xiamenensis]TVL34934.1 hypothetical protein AYI93_07345 [Shewanella xiamenensis]TVL35963.1 hypothetical protein AYI95_00370 [Shewanella xiamenensis]
MGSRHAFEFFNVVVRPPEMRLQRGTQHRSRLKSDLSDAGRLFWLGDHVGAAAKTQKLVL